MKTKALTLAASAIVILSCSDSPTGVDSTPVVWKSLTATGGDFFDSTCGLTTDGTAYCWGNNLGTPIPSRSPRRLATTARFVQIDAGFHHSCAITASGEPYCWGETDTLNRIRDPEPVTAFLGLTFSMVSAHNFWTCGLASGAIHCWSTYGPKLSLSQGNVAFKAIEYSSWYLCALATDGDAWCWDFDLENASGPQRVPGGLKFAAINIEGHRGCGVTDQHRAYCWSGTFDGGPDMPSPAGGDLLFRNIALGTEHTCGLSTTGAAYCWGRNDVGQLGVGNSVPQSDAPLAVAGGIVFQSLVIGGYHTCGLDKDGVAYCWGWNLVGEIGDGSPEPANPHGDIRWVPTRVANPR